jgi:hypothetical protein
MIPAILDFIRKLVAIIIALLLYLLPKAFAQVEPARVPLTVTDSTTVDSISTPVPINTLTDKTAPPGTGFVMKKSPWQAMWRSLVVPGFGQYYNEQYWKVPLFLGATGYLVYNIIDNQNKFIDKRAAVIAADAAGESSATLKVEREFYRDKRDEAAFYLLGVYVISVIDAYVGAHIYDFDVDEDVSASLLLLPASGGIGLQMRW